ncbi:MAG: GNAT family N-acetyltransferase [Myxococcales bacterium]|nr:GNAT family N-acetyltransferase [Myxococcales bacterium]
MSTQLRKTLRDGRSVLLRPIEPADAPRLREGLARMSPESRYRRFLAPTGALSDAKLRYLTEVDQRDHIAWGALDLDAPGLPGVGVARCVRLNDDPTAAEAAIAVVDSHQHLGLGTLLLGVLSAAAAAQGIRWFRALVLEDNAPMLTLLRQLNATIAREGVGTVRADVPVCADPDLLPNTPAGRVFRAVAADLARPPIVRFLHDHLLERVAELLPWASREHG